jgi:hypothetical protein
MIATGFTLSVLGWLILNFLGSVRSHAFNAWDWIGGVMMIVGLTAGLAGFAVILWEYLP